MASDVIGPTVVGVVDVDNHPLPIRCLGENSFLVDPVVAVLWLHQPQPGCGLAVGCVEAVEMPLAVALDGGGGDGSQIALAEFAVDLFQAFRGV
ncbi:unnamed protein product [Tuwongella immobilis]|uniref:Uncharacterized protein n=1 Tax=Tuwongella immobilis TaxID=692036 RepID=A0A6C2YUV5_9BACT|nr:unnamed protein product [Tuwongella immobilis]VTS07928.1 unnamed protein product [Tuwongella immobilis]